MLNILVVDDSIFMTKWLTKIIEDVTQNQIRYVHDGKSAIEAYKQYKPNLVFLDITMPQLDGVSALKEIIKYDSNAYVVMCSAMGQDVIIKNCFEIGAKDFVVKPFKDVEIRSKILKCFTSQE